MEHSANKSLANLLHVLSDKSSQPSAKKKRSQQGSQITSVNLGQPISYICNEQSNRPSKYMIDKPLTYNTTNTRTYSRPATKKIIQLPRTIQIQIPTRPTGERSVPASADPSNRKDKLVLTNTSPLRPQHIDSTFLKALEEDAPRRDSSRGQESEAHEAPAVETLWTPAQGIDSSSLRVIAETFSSCPICTRRRQLARFKGIKCCQDCRTFLIQAAQDNFRYECASGYNRCNLAWRPLFDLCKACRLVKATNLGFNFELDDELALIDVPQNEPLMKSSTRAQPELVITKTRPTTSKANTIISCVEPVTTQTRQVVTEKVTATTQTDQNIDRMDPTVCSVCGSRTNVRPFFTFHICQSCNSFIKEAERKNYRSECPKGGGCDLSAPKGSRNCRKCRLMRALRVGMVLPSHRPEDYGIETDPKLARKNACTCRCRVCKSKKGVSLYREMPCCESCQSFFERLSERPDENVVCLNNSDNCSLLPSDFLIKAAPRCRGCRLQKFIDVGRDVTLHIREKMQDNLTKDSDKCPICERCKISLREYSGVKCCFSCESFLERSAAKDFNCQCLTGRYKCSTKYEPGKVFCEACRLLQANFCGFTYMHPIAASIQDVSTQSEVDEQPLLDDETIRDPLEISATAATDTNFSIASINALGASDDTTGENLSLDASSTYVTAEEVSADDLAQQEVAMDTITEEPPCLPLASDQNSNGSSSDRTALDSPLSDTTIICGMTIYASRQMIEKENSVFVAVDESDETENNPEICLPLSSCKYIYDQLPTSKWNNDLDELNFKLLTDDPVNSGHSVVGTTNLSLTMEPSEALKRRSSLRVRSSENMSDNMCDLPEFRIVSTACRWIDLKKSPLKKTVPRRRKDLKRLKDSIKTRFPPVVECDEEINVIS